jgi:hypothetical protein
MSHPDTPIHVPPGEGKRVQLFGVRFRYKVDHDASGGNLGSYLVKPRDIPHAMWNSGDEPATVTEILSPAGAEQYFEELESAHGVKL